MMFFKKNLLAIFLFLCTGLGLFAYILGWPFFIISAVLASIIMIKSNNLLTPIYIVMACVIIRYLVVALSKDYFFAGVFSTPPEIHLYFDPIAVLFDFIFKVSFVIVPALIIYGIFKIVKEKPWRA